MEVNKQHCLPPWPGDPRPPRPLTSGCYRRPQEQHPHPTLLPSPPAPASSTPLRATSTSTSRGPPQRDTRSARASCQIFLTAPHHGCTELVLAPVPPQLGGTAVTPPPRAERGRTKSSQKRPNPPLPSPPLGQDRAAHTSALQGHQCWPHPFPLDRKFTSPQKSCLGWEMVGMGNCWDRKPRQG